jgi:hypothetical protein
VSDIRRGNISIHRDTKRILTIENKANYIEYIKSSKAEDELIIYHAGQYSPSKKLFFKVVSFAMPKGCVWFHWGDIDYGGFAMLARLRLEIDPAIRPFRMNIEELIRYRRLAADISDGYSKKLKELVLKPELQDCAECLDYMLANGIRLEQEAMLTE